MKELSVFIDESGDFGEYSSHSPYYIIAMVFHDQKINISPEVQKLEREMDSLNIRKHFVHAGPIIRREEDYKHMDIYERRRILNKMVAFVERIEIKYHCFVIEKKYISDNLEAISILSKQIFAFVKENYEFF